MSSSKRESYRRPDCPQTRGAAAKPAEFIPRRAISHPDRRMYFEIVGEITDVEIIAAGPSIRDLSVLQERHGEGRWRKLKGQPWVRLSDGRLHRAEVHWYEAHGIGRKV